MSEEQLDNDLRDRIKQVFDDYQDDTAAEGWLLLREKYPEGKKNRAIIWWRVAGVAALLLLCLNIFFWFKDDSSYKNKIASIRETKYIDSVAFSSKGTKPLKQDPSVQTIVKSTITIGQPLIFVDKQLPVSHNSVAAAHNQQSLNNKSTNTPLVDNGSKLTDATDLIAKDKLPLMDSAKINAQPSLVNNDAANKRSIVAVQQQPVVVSKSMQQLFDKEDKAKKNTQIKQPAINKFALGIYAASYVNYAKGSQRQFNNGAGISSDIRLNDNLSISTGVAIGQNTLAYNNSSPSSPIPAALLAANSRNFTASASTLPVVVPSSRNLNANLVNLDVPVNLKYNFNPQTGNTYFAAGLSSGTFINESYNTIYTYNSTGNSVQQLQDGSHKSFDNFYFAQMLNLAFGLGYPLGKNQLVIEPFFKYPLNGLGDQHILFGSGGINLKFNFETGKTK